MSIEGAVQSIWPVPPQWWLLAQWQSTSAHSAACALDRIALVHALPVHIIFKILSLSFKFFGRNQMFLKLIQCTPSPERCNDATELLAMSPKVFAFGIEKAKKKKKKDGKRLVCVQKINQFASESDDLFGWVMQRDARRAQDTLGTLCSVFVLVFPSLLHLSVYITPYAPFFLVVVVVVVADSLHYAHRLGNGQDGLLRLFLIILGALFARKFSSDAASVQFFAVSPMLCVVFIFFFFFFCRLGRRSSVSWLGHQLGFDALFFLQSPL